MKLKVALLFLVVIIACTQPSSGQMIGDMIFLPASPDTNDFFSIDVYTFFTSSPCVLVDSLTEINISNDTISIKAMYSIGVLTTPCTRNDTFNIGILTAGTFFLHFELHIYEFNPSLQDIKDTIVIVEQATLIKENVNDISVINLFPNPFSEIVTVVIKTANDKFPLFFKLFDSLGRTVKEIQNVQNEKFEVNRQGIADGIYIYRIRDNKGNFFYGKVVIQ